MNYKIINSGSDGNAVLVDDTVLIDCGVTFGKIEQFYKNLKLVLLTHIHSDHFNKNTIKRLARLRPALRFGCGEWLREDLLELGIEFSRIDVYKFGTTYNYGSFGVENFELYHDVPQCGYKIFYKEKKLIYATDTRSINHVEAKNYDVYLIEANYKDEETLKARSDNEEYVKRVLNTHLSSDQAIQWLLDNMADNSIYEFMHQHKEKELSKRFINIKPLLDKVTEITELNYELTDNGIYSALSDLLMSYETKCKDAAYGKR